MIWLYFWSCGLFYLGASLDELPKGTFKRALFYLSCFIEGAIGTPMAIGAAVWVYIKNNEKKDDTDMAHCNNESCPVKDRCKRFTLFLEDCACDMHYCTYLHLTEESKERAERLGSCPHFLLNE